LSKIAKITHFRKQP